jgi:predicted secreted hydrolase
MAGAVVLGAVVAAQAPVTVAGWRQAGPGYEFEFPRDHGNHPDYRIEWWYYTGNLAAEDGRRFGYQVTFFRIGVDPAPVNPSRWAVRDLYMAHLAVTDVAGGRQQVAERFDRGGVGWAGASEGTLDVWNADWRASLDGERHRLDLLDNGFGVELQLDPGTGATLHGDAGLSRKGEQPGNASHYYSMTRMPTAGRLLVDGEWVEVSGESWMDHEFGTSFLEPGQVGWDWFSLQLDDGSDLMLFQLRRADGSRDAHSAGTWLAADGRQTSLVTGDFTLTPGRRWTSPSSGAAYPVEWSIDLPLRDARLEVAPLVDAQELHTDQSTGVTYWEGAVSVRGEVDGREVSGRGYLEMTGYVGRPMSEMFR